MKKLSILLLVIALAGGMAFGADIDVTGEASLDAVVDLEAGTFGLVNGTDTADIDFSLTLASGAAEGVGEGDVYAAITISAGIDAYVDGYDADGSGAIDGTETADNELNAWASVDSADIYAGDWTISILGSPSSFDNAISIDYDGDDAEDFDDTAAGFGGGTGATISYMDYTLGVEYTVAGAYAFSAAGTVEVADGVSVTGGVAYDGAAFGATVAASLAIGDEGTVDVAADLDGAAFDIAATIDYAPVVVDVYYGAALSAQTAFDFDDISVTVYGLDLLGAMDLNASASTTVDAATITLGAGYTVGTAAWDVNGTVAYAMDDADVTATLAYDGTLTAGLNVTSSTVIDNASVYADWTSNDLLAAGYGTITTGVTVSL